MYMWKNICYLRLAIKTDFAEGYSFDVALKRLKRKWLQNIFDN